MYIQVLAAAAACAHLRVPQMKQWCRNFALHQLWPASWMLVWCVRLHQHKMNPFSFNVYNSIFRLQRRHRWARRILTFCVFLRDSVIIRSIRSGWRVTLHCFSENSDFSFEILSHRWDVHTSISRTLLCLRNIRHARVDFIKLQNDDSNKQSTIFNVNFSHAQLQRTTKKNRMIHRCVQ